MDSMDDRDLYNKTKDLMSTTISTIVVQGGPLQLVIALLQVRIISSSDSETLWIYFTLKYREIGYKFGYFVFSVPVPAECRVFQYDMQIDNNLYLFTIFQLTILRHFYYLPKINSYSKSFNKLNDKSIYEFNSSRFL